MKRLQSNDHELSVELSLLEGLRKRMPEDKEVLKILAEDYTRVGRWQEGLEVDLKLSLLIPDDPMVHYNLACSLSLVNRVKESAKALTRAIELGYREWDWLRKDPDLENLRKSRDFIQVTKLLKPLSK